MTHFRQIFEPRTFAFTYLLGDDSGAAVVIDAGSERTTLPVLAMLAELNLRLDYLMQTHVHDDEPNDVAAIKERSGAWVVAPRSSSPACSMDTLRKLSLLLYCSSAG